MLFLFSKYVRSDTLFLIQQDIAFIFFLLINILLLLVFYLLLLLVTSSLRGKCPYSEFFWSLFSCIWTKYGPEKLGIRTLFTQCLLLSYFISLLSRYVLLLNCYISLRTRYFSLLTRYFWLLLITFFETVKSPKVKISCDQFFLRKILHTVLKILPAKIIWKEFVFQKKFF